MSNIRKYDHVKGTEQSGAPTPTLVTEDRVASGVATIAALKAIDASSRSSGQIRVIAADNSAWAFDETSVETGNDTTVITPTSGTGRWKLLMPVNPDDIDLVFSEPNDYTENKSVRATTQFPWTTPTRISPPTTAGGSGRDVAWSPNGEFLAVGNGATPYLEIFQKIGNTFLRLADPSSGVGGGNYSLAWSPCGIYLAVGHRNGDILTIYKRSGNTFTKLSVVASPPTASSWCFGAAFSESGEFLAVAFDLSPFVHIYRRAGDVFTKLTNPATLPTGAGYAVGWSPDGRFLAVGHDTTPFISVYERTALDTFTKISNPATLPASTVNSVQWSPDGKYLAVGHYTTPFLTVYSRSGTTLTKLTNPSSLPASTVTGVSWSPNGKILALRHNSSPYLTLYNFDAGSFSAPLTTVTNPPVAASQNDKCRFSNDGQYLAVTEAASQTINVYQTGSDISSLKRLKVLAKKRDGSI